MMLLSVLLGLAYGGFRAATRAADRGQAVLEESSRLRLAHQFVHRQLNQILPMMIANPEGDGPPPVFEGDATRIRYVGPMPGYLGFGGPQVQELRIASGENDLQLNLSHALLQGFEEANLYERAPIMLIDGIESGSFLFQGLDEEGEPGPWENTWEDTDVLPQAIALELELNESAQVDWPGLIASVRIDGTAIQRYLREANLEAGDVRSTSIKDLIDRRRQQN